MKRLIFFILFLILLAILSLYEGSLMTRIEYVEENNTGQDAFFVVIMLAIGLLTYLSYIKYYPSRYLLSRRIVYLVLWGYIISLLYSLLYPFARVNYGLIILPLVFYIYSSVLIGNVVSEKVFLWSMTMVYAFIVFTFVVNQSLDMSTRISLRRNSAAYYVMYMLPLMLCHPLKIIRLLSIAVGIVCVMYSMKFGGVLALILAAMVYMFTLQKIEKNRYFKYFIFLFSIFVIVVGYYSIIYVNNFFLQGDFLDRIDESQKTGGSGRMDIYMYFINMIFSGNPIEFLLGRGWIASERVNTWSHLSCHNDFLETFVDFGLIGFILYVYLYIALIKLYKQMLVLKHKYAPAMGASIAIFFVCSMVSHIYICIWYFLFFTLFWGFVVASTKSNIQFIRK